VVLGTGEVEAIVGAIEQAPAAASRPVAVPVTFHRARPSRTSLQGHGARRHRDATVERELPTYLYDATTPRILTTPKHYAYVKIAEGCDYNCAFCIIPKLRAQYRSRPVESIVAEARSLAARGVKELLLISQDSSFYGVDRRERGALARTLREWNAVEGLAWIRLLYLYPTTVTEETIEAMAT